MKKIFGIVLLCAVAVSAMAVPARRGWQSRTQADGTQIEVQVVGDEYYHYMINRDGKHVRLNADGMYQVVGEAPTAAQVKVRRAQAQRRRARKDVGVTPYPAPRGLLILVNFSDLSFKAANTAAVLDSLITAKNCQVNNGYGSAAQYFKDQSHGLYQPEFDVYGPVTLSKTYSYYGRNDSEGNDQYATDAVIEACTLANQQYEDLDFANYDWNNDGEVDFVYVIYAGYGEADYSDNNTIWPHNYTIQDIVAYYQYGYSKYQKSQTKLDGVYLNNYAMSNEIDGQTNKLVGIGTFCHEFGHVLGLPDFYDTSYGTNYISMLTPNEWDVMDGGAYNGNGHCPPNYSAWEKYFMGWNTPINPGTEGRKLTLKANGTEDYQAYQINASGTQEKATKEGVNYYIENRQKQGWDTYLPYSGMLIWKVNFSATKWTNNEPNNAGGNPRYTLIIPSGTKIGEDYGKKNVWPYTTAQYTYDAREDVTGKPLKDITRVGEDIELIYIEDKSEGIEDLILETEGAQKVLIDGKVMIIRNGKIYDLNGRLTATL